MRIYKIEKNNNLKSLLKGTVDAKFEDSTYDMYIIYDKTHKLKIAGYIFKQYSLRNLGYCYLDFSIKAGYHHDIIETVLNFIDTLTSRRIYLKSKNKFKINFVKSLGFKFISDNLYKNVYVYNKDQYIEQIV